MKTAAIFSNHMVLQQGLPVPVWGWAEPGETVTVSMAGQTASAGAGSDGRWRARLPALAAGGPFDLVVTGSREIRCRDVMVGEVWICSGQSNMQMAVRDCAEGEREIREANHPGIRLFTVPNVALAKPAPDVQAQWAACSPDTIAGFAATAYYFGRHLHRELGVPVGLVNTSWGGSRIEAWISRDTLLADPEARLEALDYEKALESSAGLTGDYDRRVTEYRQWEEQNLPKDAGNSGFAKGWADPVLDLTGWGEINLPRYWQNAGHLISGVFWFRRDVEIPSQHAGQDLVLRLGAVDKTDTTYFNNVPVGGIGKDKPNCWAIPREYTVPGRLVKPGRNTIAVRVMSDCYAGGFAGNPPDLNLTVPGADRPLTRLDGSWSYRIEQDFGRVVPPPPPLPPFGDGNCNSPHILFDNMIRPLAPFASRGAIWYQGESNAHAPGRYQRLQPALIRDWRNAWDHEAFGFFLVQLPNFMPRGSEPGPSAWAEFREVQQMAIELPNTGMAVTIDLGDPVDIHPKNKQDVGKRLALAALGITYKNVNVVYSGPLFKSCAIKGGKAIIRFLHVGSGLVVHGDRLAGFAMAGKDRQFVWADALIEKNTVVVSSPKVAKPVAVRYAWADNPEATLYNREGLPAAPFRTDSWEH